MYDIKRKDVNITSIQSGECLHIYSNKHNVTFFILDKNEKTLYKVTTDKLLNIEYLDEVALPVNFINLSSIKFFTPKTFNDELTYSGIVVINNVASLFKMSDSTNIIEYVRDAVNSDWLETTQLGRLLTCMGTFTVHRYVQKKQTIYAIGYDNEIKSSFYCIADTSIDKVVKLYYLNSDVGEIIPSSIVVDENENRVLIAGKIVEYDTNSVTPYYETFITSQC